MGRLFGTDGVRGLANADLTPSIALRSRPRPLVFCSTILRRSGTGRLRRLRGGAQTPAQPGAPTALPARSRDARGRSGRPAGVDVLLLGVILTPAVPFSRRQDGRGRLRDARQASRSSRPAGSSSRTRSRTRSRLAWVCRGREAERARTEPTAMGRMIPPGVSLSWWTAPGAAYLGGPQDAGGG